ncbi:hypothetical protein DCAR_0205297 [Daucus carota subsp. sativus]|uniref:Pre-mRNA-processing factor 19 n=1 Tax=Daucus carota subsp. sativus TaxID=79200 RepID=A0AAF1AK27_DAUCS|nr:hypothetical protein DCAR_0205297 [Daucus carota subsp. sativus]
MLLCVWFTSGAVVKIWNVKSQVFDGQIGVVNAISFSENGYFLTVHLHISQKFYDMNNSQKLSFMCFQLYF